MAKEPTEIKFGTDGWRARIDHEFNIHNLERCAIGVSKLLHSSESTEKTIVIGYDTRYKSKEFAKKVADTLAKTGIDVVISDSPVPTPVVSYNVVNLQAAAGIVITASHNPSDWNGFKFKTSFGVSASVELVEKLESYINESSLLSTVSSSTSREIQGSIESIDLSEDYFTNIEKNLDLTSIRQSGLKVAVDSMHGAGGGYIEKLLSGHETQVVEIRSNPNPLFPGMKQPEPIALNLKPLKDLVISSEADVGLALDGDADRLGVLDENGNFLTTLSTFSLLCLHLLHVKQYKGALVRSITQSRMVDQLAKSYRVEAFTTPVGFKFVGPIMQEEDALAAGEESGGYAFRGNIAERDGIFSGLLFLEMLVMTGKRPSELLEWLYSIVGEHHYDRADIPIKGSLKSDLRNEITHNSPRKIADLTVEEVSDSEQDGIFFSLENNYWALIRPSGTEPLIRVYCEADSKIRTARIITELTKILGTGS